MVITHGKPILILLCALVLLASLPGVRSSAEVVTPVPQDRRGRLDAERLGHHDANNMRTRFWNFGMVGDYPADPGNVDLSVFHSVEVPKGSGMNYSDGITPFVLAKITQTNGVDAYIMETGFRERQGTSPFYNRVMRFEPRPGYFQAMMERSKRSCSGACNAIEESSNQFCEPVVLYKKGVMAAICFNFTKTDILASAL